jgi:hypothetical protein
MVSIGAIATLTLFVVGSSQSAGAGLLVEDPGRPPLAKSEVVPPARAPMRRVLYMNFDGVDLQWCGEGEDDPHGDCSTIFQGVVLPYKGDTAARAAVMQTVAADLVDFDVVLTTERPLPEIDYDMEMIGQWSPGGMFGFLGIAPKIDCFDGDGGDVSFTLDPPTLEPVDTAKVVLQEAAHTWGLEHVDATGDLLFPTVGNAPDPKFEDMCSPITYEPVQCPRQHAPNCPEGEQNSYQEMLTLFGPRQPDDIAPTVTIVSPQDGAHVPTSFDLVLELHDDASPQVFSTSIEFVDAFTSDVELGGPGVFPIALNDVPDGVYTVVVTAADPAGNQGDALIEIVVGNGAPQSADESGSGSGATSAGSSDGGADSTSGGGSESTGGPMQMGGDDGCNCGVRRSTTVPSCLLLVLAVVRRRARRC